MKIIREFQKLYEGRIRVFFFNFIDKRKISKEINKLDRKKANQKNDIPVKFIKSNKDLLSHFRCDYQ